MNEVDEARERLIETIRESEEYHRYQDAKRQLKENPQLEQSVNLFRKRNYQLQADKTSDLFQRSDLLYEENRELMNEPVVAEFLAAELAFCRVVQHINWSIIEGLDFDIEFMNE